MIIGLCGNMKTACIAFAEGCPRSEFDAALLVKYFKENGWKITTKLQEADVVLIGTCGFDTLAEEKSINFLLIAARKKRKNAKLIIFGCLPGINQERLLKKFDAVLITPRTLDRLDRLIESKVKLRHVQASNLVSESTTACAKSFSLIDNFLVKFRLSLKFPVEALTRICVGRGLKPLYECYDKIYDIKIAQGCMENCSYCAIKFATGSLVSKPLDEILTEFHTGLSQGNEVFRLIATDVGSYGQDIKTNIAELLRRIFNHQEHFRLIFSDFNPKWLICYFPELFEILITNSHRIGYIGFPIQSGSEKIIRLMNRGHTVEDARKCMLTLQQASPKLTMTTHVLVGFPGETEEDFEETVRLVKLIKFAQVSLFKYWDRQNTVAAKLPKKIERRVKYQRILRFRKEFKSACTIR